MSIYEYDDKKRKRHRKPITSDMWINIYIYNYINTYFRYFIFNFRYFIFIRYYMD